MAFSVFSKMPERISIRDLAEKLGVSHTTVSLALRNSPRIAEATRRRICAEAKRLGYHPDTVVSNLMARLRTLRTTSARETIGFITAWPSRAAWRGSANHARFFEGCRRHAGALGYNLDEFWLNEPGMTSRRMSSILLARGIRGLVLLSLPTPEGKLALDWKHFICVTKGLTVRHPPVHRVISSHYEDMQVAMAQLKRRGYRRIGLVLGETLSERVDRAWLASYLLHNNERAPEHRVPALITRSPSEEQDFARWYRLHQPEVILFSEQPMRRWVESLGLHVPNDVGLVHLDWSTAIAPLAGIDSDPEVQGEAAIDLLVGQMQANEYGVPKHEKIIAVRGRWVPGASIRKIGA